VGDVLRFVRGGGGIEAGERALSSVVDERRNLLRLQLESNGLARVINPKERRAFDVERVEQRRFAVGDRIQFRERDRCLDVANAPWGRSRSSTMSEPWPRSRSLRGASGSISRSRKHWITPYAVTSHRSQGLSRERVYLTVDTSHSEELINRRQFYVGVSRAVEDARVYTDEPHGVGAGRLARNRAVRARCR